MTDEPSVGDLVTFMWGVSEVRGTVAEVYGETGRRQVVLALDPDITGYVVAEPTTLSLPIDKIGPVAAA